MSQLVVFVINKLLGCGKFWKQENSRKMSWYIKAKSVQGLLTNFSLRITKDVSKVHRYWY